MTQDLAVQNAGASNEASIIFARLIGLFAVAFGSAVVFGWYVDEPLLKQGVMNGLTIKANAGIGFIVAGLGLLALTSRFARPAARLLGLVLVAAAGATLSQDVMGWDLQIDEKLFVDPLGNLDVGWPGRISPGAALSFVLMGCVLFLTGRRARMLIFVTEVMLAMILVLSITNLIGHSYQFTQNYNPFPFTAMPIHMAVALAITAAGLSAACPDRGFAKALLDRSAGGQMIRRLLPSIIAIPIVLGWFVHRGLLQGLFSDAVGTAVFAVSSIVVMAGFTWLTANALRRSDSEREEALFELHGQREWLTTTLVSIADAVIATDRTGAVEIMNPVAERLTGWTLQEARATTIETVFHIIDESTQEKVENPALRAQREDRVIALEDSVLVRKDDIRIPIEYTSSPILNTRGKVAGAVLIFRDITDRRRTEEQQQMLVSELNHRVRNVLMIVQSLVQANAQYTAGKSTEEMAKVLANRLQSLGRAHELLLDTQWSGASLNKMVELELAPFRQDDSRKVTLKGRDVLLPPQCTSVVAMALHELTTNAVKYGALSTPDGRLNVNWSVRGSRLTINWRETHANVSKNREPGFGMRLIDRGIRQNLGGDTRVEFADDGLSVTMRIPLGDRERKIGWQARLMQTA